MQKELVRSASALDFVWLEITRKCPLQCEHCYNESGPTGTHGDMTTADWLRVIREVRELGARHVQFIGGEPMLHPDLAELINQALAVGLEVEVFTNLVHVPTHLWEVLGQDGVKVATSAYSDDESEHDSITRGPKSFTRTMTNIARVVDAQIPLRVGLIEVRDGQRVEQARTYLEGLGVDPDQIGSDHLRQVGRGERTQTADASQLCGWCTSDNLAVLPDGSVTPCVFSSWLAVGNVLTDSLRTIHESPARRDTDAELDACFTKREANCRPSCNPGCNPSYCNPGGRAVCAPDHCHPASPASTAPCYPLSCRPGAPAAKSTCRPGGTCSPGIGCSPNCSPRA